MAGSHIELRKRNERFAKNIGKSNPLKTTDPLDKKRPLSKVLVGTLLFIVLGGVFFEFAQQIFLFFYPPKLAGKA